MNSYARIVEGNILEASQGGAAMVGMKETIPKAGNLETAFVIGRYFIPETLIDLKNLKEGFGRN